MIIKLTVQFKLAKYATSSVNQVFFWSQIVSHLFIGAVFKVCKALSDRGLTSVTDWLVSGSKSLAPYHHGLQSSNP